MDTYQTSIKGRYINHSVTEEPILSTTDKHETTIWFASRTDLSGKVMHTNDDLPNTYSGSTTETIMHPVGQNIPVIYPHFETEIVQPPQFLNLEDSKNIRPA